MLKKYKTIFQQAEAEIIEKKSRFIATVKPVKKEEEARLFIDEMKKKYWNATHNVFAYQLGESNDIQRCSDDGEPSNTAGKPILDILMNEDIKNVAVVVTRYFGGTLLGTGGLIRAYSKAAKQGLIAANIVEKILYIQFSIITDYTLSGKVQYEILQMQTVLQDTSYTHEVEYIVLVELEQSELFYKKLIEVSAGKVKIKRKQKLYGIWVNGELFVE